MALATLADVKRVLRITTVDSDRDDQLTEALAVADSWFRTRARGRFDESGSGTATYDVVRYGQTVHLPVPGSTVTTVEAGSPTDLEELTTEEYVVLDDRRVRIGRIDSWPYDPRRTTMDFPADRITYERVRITYTAPSTVPEAVRDGIAKLAAAEWLVTGGGEGSASGIVSEKIGDYSYTIGSEGTLGPDDFRANAMLLLRPFVRAKISST